MASKKIVNRMDKFIKETRISGQPEEVPDLLRGTKGLKRRKKEDHEIQQTEDKLIITTVSK